MNPEIIVQSIITVAFITAAYYIYKFFENIAGRKHRPEKKEGVITKYYENGKIKSESNYINWKMHGEVKGWYESGEIWSLGYYENDVPVGVTREWYKNGQLEIEYNWKNNATDVIIKCWDEEGNEISHKELKKRRKIH